MFDLPEIWRPIAGFEHHYEVSSIGRVRSIPRRYCAGRVRRTSIGNHGYRAVMLYVQSKPHARLVHRLVADAFVGLCPDGEEVRHLDGDRLNNCASNLAYGTRSQNNRDKVQHGTDQHSNRTHCPRSHLLQSPNLVSAKILKGVRECLACARGRSYVQHHPEMDLVQVSRHYYEEIMVTL